jgi:hypothetical protein
MKINYEILSTFSTDDLVTYSPLINFHGIDSPYSESYYPAANKNGIGSCNNMITPSVTSGFSPFQGWGNYNPGNQARIDRMVKNTSFDPANVANDTLLNFTTTNNVNTVGKNYVQNSNSTTAIQYNILATIPLAVIHDLFRKLPLTKNLYLKLVINFHANFTCQLTVTMQELCQHFQV